MTQTPRVVISSGCTNARDRQGGVIGPSGVVTATLELPADRQAINAVKAATLLRGRTLSAMTDPAKRERAALDVRAGLRVEARGDGRGNGRTRAPLGMTPRVVGPSDEQIPA